MKQAIILMSLATLLSVSSAAIAEPPHHHHAPRTAMAKVTHVEPVYRYVRVATPHRECWREPVHSYQGGYQSYTGTIAGGIVGGVIGNQFGGGSGKTAMTVAGTLLGGSVGRDMTHRNSHRPQQSRETCRVTESYHEQRELDYYRVSYRYKGQLYSTHMDHHPGKHIPVDVHVTPSQQRRYYY